ncbi:hypothetical protein CcCBS67573_g07408 [Chytriomyces confervae]|uniref:SH3 domain-containing protein n=1 Tax=Chytriomyces confervae TaxID=246404 RepID=A0A507EWQ6_9FUNG|nr:hypothetical protein CcCBS67573_g07408 [Chytriomyces confervae]
MADVPESTSTRPDAVSVITLISKLASIESTQPSSASASISTIPILTTVSLSGTVSTAFSVAAIESIATVTQPSLPSSSQQSSSLPSVAPTSTIASVIPATTRTQPALPFVPTFSSLSSLSTPSSTASVNGAIESNSTSSVNKSPITGSMSTIIFAGVGGLGVLLLVAGVIFFRRMGKSKAEKPVPIDSFNNLDHRGNQTPPTFERNEYGEESSVELKHQQALQTRQTTRAPTPVQQQQHTAVQINNVQYPVPVPPHLVLQQQLYDPGAAAVAAATVYQEYSVSQAHFAQSQGELALMLGDIVVLMHDYNNGWAYGYNKSAMVYGTFPVACVSETHMVAAKRISTPIQADSKPQSLSVSSKTVEKELTFNVGQVYTAVASFIPDRDDEIGLCIGDKIELLHIFDDAWADGFNNSTNKDGFFPLECLNPDINLPATSDTHRSYPQRVSSDYNQAPTLKLSAKVAHDPSRASAASTVAEQHTSPPSASSNARIVAAGTRTMEVRHSLPDSSPGKSPKHPSLYSIDSVYMAKSDHLQKENDTLERNEFSKRTSSIYSAVGSRASLYTIEERKEEPLLYTVIHYFQPQLEDEIELCVRDKVRLLEEFNDGWAVVFNLETDEEGMVPLRCVERE